MPRQRYPLDEPVGRNGESREQMILAAIRGGAFPRVAAEVWGLPGDVLDRWLRQARSQRRRPPRAIVAFAERVRQAVAHARLTAELEIRTKDPKFWLCHGPGRDTKSAPGWTSAVKPAFLPAGGSRDVLASPESQRLCELILRTLTAFPDARAAVAAALGSCDRAAGGSKHSDR
jgi:hypothetical protein